MGRHVQQSATVQARRVRRLTPRYFSFRNTCGTVRELVNLMHCAAKAASFPTFSESTCASMCHGKRQRHSLKQTHLQLGLWRSRSQRFQLGVGGLCLLQHFRDHFLQESQSFHAKRAAIPHVHGHTTHQNRLAASAPAQRSNPAVRARNPLFLESCTNVAVDCRLSLAHTPPLADVVEPPCDAGGSSRRRRALQLLLLLFMTISCAIAKLPC